MDSFVDFAQLRVLVVDDERYARDTVCALLQRLGVTHFTSAINGEAGLRLVTSYMPSLILCDIHMQPVDGLQFVTTLRGYDSKRFANIPVILLTADSNKSTITAGREAGANSYLVKPVELNGLKGRIASVMNGKKSI